MNEDSHDVLIQRMRRRFWLKMGGLFLIGIVCITGFVSGYAGLTVLFIFIVYIVFEMADLIYRCPFCRKEVKRIPAKRGTEKSYFAYVLPDKCPHCSLELKALKYLFRWPTKRSNDRPKEPIGNKAKL